MSKRKGVGATFGTSHPQATQCVLTDPSVGLFDFIMADDTLCQVSQIELTSELTVEDAVKIANGRKKRDHQNVVAMLDVIGTYGEGIQRCNHPVQPGTILQKADTSIIQKYMGFNQSFEIRVGTMLRRHDVEVRLTRNMFDTHIAVIGMTNQGKSNLGKILLQQLKNYGARIVVIDPHGEYPGNTINMDNLQIEYDCITDDELIRVLVNEVPKRFSNILQEAISLGLYRIKTKKLSLAENLLDITDHRTYEKFATLRPHLITVLKSKTLLQRLLESMDMIAPGNPLVVNLKGVDKITGQEIVSIISEKALSMGKSGVGCYIFLDEAHRYVPQKGSPDSKLHLIDLIQEGRKFGCGVVLMSQRPANIDKDALSQCNTIICLKITNANDVRQVRDSTEYSSAQMFREVQRLEKGEALLTSCYIERPVFIKIDKWEPKE